MDIKFEANNISFNVRSSCIIKDKKHKKIIFTNMRAIKSNDAYLLPGGRLELLENSKQAIERELKEELGLEVSCSLVSIQENIVKETGFHMLEFIYYTQIDSFDKITITDNEWDKFKIINIDEIENYDIRPKPIKQLIIMEEYTSLTHNINYDWGKE